jgi:hypothetical protein
MTVYLKEMDSSDYFFGWIRSLQRFSAIIDVFGSTQCSIKDDVKNLY